LDYIFTGSSRGRGLVGFGFAKRSIWLGPNLAIPNPELISTDAPRIVSEDPTKVTDSFWFPADCPLLHTKDSHLPFAPESSSRTGTLAFRGSQHTVEFHSLQIN